MRATTISSIRFVAGNSVRRYQFGSQSRLSRRVIGIIGLILSFPIGEQMTVNGLPMKLQGFLSEAAPAELIAQFRKALGKPLVENAIGSKQLLGRAMNTYYLTVQVEPAGRGSRGVVAISDLKGMHDHRSELQSANTRWLNRFPSGSKIESQLTS